MTYRMYVVEVWVTALGDDRNPKSEANDNDGAGKEGLDGLMSFEPSTGRGPEVSGD